MGTSVRWDTESWRLLQSPQALGSPEATAPLTELGKGPSSHLPGQASAHAGPLPSDSASGPTGQPHGGAAGGAEKIYHLGWTPTGRFLALHTYMAHDLCSRAACLFISQMGSKHYYLSLRHSQLSIVANIHMPLFFFFLWGNDRLHLLVIDFK